MKVLEKIKNIPISKDECNMQIKEIFHWESYKPPKKKNDLIVDFGANIGMATLYLKQFAKVVHAVEPSPKIFKALQDNVGDIKNVFLHKLAINVINGKCPLFSVQGHPPQTLYAERITNKKRQSIKVDCVTIEKFLDDNDIKKVDVLKVDIEGSEYPLFMSESFSNVADRIDCIVGEAHIVKVLGTFPESIPYILKEHGYKTKFVKTKEPNYEHKVSYLNSNTKYKKEVTVPMWTNFIATR